MKEQLQKIYDLAMNDLKEVQSIADIENFKLKYLSRKGELNSIKRNLKDLSDEDKRIVGAFANEIANNLETSAKEKYDYFYKQELNQKLKKECIDVTLPGNYVEMGHIHPITETINEITNIFHSLGFSVAPDENSPEVETEYYHFDGLNFPKDHPARDMQDTFYITDNILLRPHTSPGQVRTMEKGTLPIKILSPGRVYRADDDASHSPMFHQIEGLVVDKGVSLCDLQGLLDVFVKNMFDSQTKTRFRPSYFPFTEPSVEVDVTCCKCHGKGCSLCKGTGWIEILGAGIVNKNVLEMSGIDSNVYSGLAFGFGIERITMIKYGISDIRTLFESNVKFLKQFNRR